jgi:polyisoprenoid-binding protein YceI
MSPFAKVQNIGFSASGSFKRSDFGVNNWINFGIGDQVDLIIETEFLKKD